jgi:hypothetical protein
MTFVGASNLDFQLFEKRYVAIKVFENLTDVTHIDEQGFHSVDMRWYQRNRRACEKAFVIDKVDFQRGSC